MTVFPLMFTSSALVPDSFLPAWMQAVSAVNPISYVANATRALMTTGFDWKAILPAYGYVAVLMLVTWGAALYEFRRVIK
jgi:ABC-2 type transport system permease protein